MEKKKWIIKLKNKIENSLLTKLRVFLDLKKKTKCKFKKNNFFPFYKGSKIISKMNFHFLLLFKSDW